MALLLEFGKGRGQFRKHSDYFVWCGWATARIQNDFNFHLGDLTG